MKDYILSATAAAGAARVFIAKTTDAVNRAFEIHKTSPVVTAGFGRLLTAGAIMGCTLKNETDLLTVTVKGDGPLKGMLVTADAKARVKGYPYESLVDLPLNEYGKLDVGKAVGSGTLTVIKDMGLKEPYSGQTALVTGEIGDDLSYYYVTSEQLPTAFGLGVLVDTDYKVRHAGGFLLQLMPGATEELARELENNVNRLPYITDLMDLGFTPERILESLMSGKEYVINARIEPEYYCGCDWERVTKAVISLGRSELEKIIKEDNKATLHCHFCNKYYDFTGSQLEEILKTL